MGFIHVCVRVFIMERCCSLCSHKVCSYLCCIMPPLHVIRNDNYQTLSSLQNTKTQVCWTTLLLSVGTVHFQMEAYRDVMYRKEGSYGGIILTVVKNYKYKSNPTTLNEYMPYHTQYHTAVDLLSKVFPWLELSYKTNISSNIYLCVTLCCTCGKFPA